MRADEAFALTVATLGVFALGVLGGMSAQTRNPAHDNCTPYQAVDVVHHGEQRLDVCLDADGGLVMKERKR